jgi:UDP-4-amino-4,6-dideoxy-N-acetyl-beta-L-altrosamine transaminase
MTQQPTRLPYGLHSIDQDDIDAVSDVLRSDWLTGGPAVTRFETALSAATAAPYSVVCANGTAALHMAAAALGLGPGDHIIVPAVTFLATANAARYVDAEVVFADVDPKTGLMTVDTLSEALARAQRQGQRVRAVFPVHLNGQVADPQGIWRVASEAGLEIVDDACHAIGTTFETAQGPARAGEARYARMSVFSFHPVKTIAMGEGGAVTTADPAIAHKLRLLRSHGMTRDPRNFTQPSEAFDRDGGPNPWYYEMAEPGYNFRASDIACALGASQLGKLDRFVAARRELVARYDNLLGSLGPHIRPIDRVAGCDPAWHLYVVLIDFEALGITRATAMRRLAEKGIGTQVHYLPVNRQPYYRSRYGEINLPGANAYYERCLSLPLFATMTEADVDRVVRALAEVCHGTVAAS